MPSIALIETLFALIVFIAVLAVVLDTYAEVVVAAALFVLIWKLFLFTGASLVLATILIMAIALVKFGAEFLYTLFEADTEGTRDVTTFLDTMLTTQDRPDDEEDRQERRRARRHDSSTDEDSIRNDRR
jgi:hypothetical protein